MKVAISQNVLQDFSENILLSEISNFLSPEISSLDYVIYYIYFAFTDFAN